MTPWTGEWSLKWRVGEGELGEGEEKDLHLVAEADVMLLDDTVISN